MSSWHLEAIDVQVKTAEGDGSLTETHLKRYEYVFLKWIEMRSAFQVINL